MAQNKGYMAKIGLDTSDIDKQINSLNRELKTIDKSLKENGDSAELNAQKYTVLSKEIEATKKKLEQLQNQEKAAAEALKNEQITDEEYRKFRREVENTTAALGKLEKELRDLDEPQQKNNANIAEWLEHMKGDLASAAIQKLIGLMAQLGQATVQLVQDAAAAYGQYEQLVGGVETLFSGAEDTVIQNAQNAFQTAGISANTYMQQVTSFSASLVNSLAGDTKKAAELADTAIRDMSDNANKMGIDMASIQNAYQGFAKQNYTMLDNLKLGYGGNKTEMKRLIDDANELKKANGEAGDLTIEKFSDVVEAIHLVQQQMGITGTTAAEAAGTIEGSAGAAQAAWENLVRGLADPSADLDALLDDFINSKTVELENLLPTIEHSIEGITQAVEKLIPKLTESGGIFDEMLTEVSEKAPDLIVALANNVIKGLPKLADAALTIAENLITSIGRNMPELMPTLVKVIGDTISMVVSHASEIVEAGMELVKGIAKGLAEAIPQLLDSAGEIVGTLAAELIELTPQLLTVGLDIGEKIAEGFKDFDWVGAAEDAVNAIWNAFDQALANTTGYETLPEQEKRQAEADKALAEAQAELEKAREARAEAAREAAEANTDAARYQAFLQTASGETIAETTEDFAEILAETEKQWDILYKYDKKNQEEYWENRRKYLSTHKNNSEAWWNAWNETEKHFSDKAAKQEKEQQQERDKQKKAAEDAEKKRISDLKSGIDNAFKELEIEATQSGKDKGWLLERQREYIDTLDKSSDLYKGYDQKWRKDWADWEAKKNEEEKKRIEEAEKEARKNTDNWQKYAEKQIDAQKKAVEKIQQAEKKTADNYNKRLQDFEEVTDAKGDKRLIFASVKDKIKELETYEKNLEKLKTKDLPEGMLEDIMSMSFDQRALYVKELLRMSDKQRSSYFADYSKYRKTAERIAHSEYEDDYKDAATASAQATADIWAQMPQNATEEGRKAAKAYIDGYTAYMKENGLDTTAVTAMSSAMGVQNGANSYSQAMNGNLTINVAGKQAMQIALKDIFKAMKNAGAVLDV